MVGHLAATFDADDVDPARGERRRVRAGCGPGRRCDRGSGRAGARGGGAGRRCDPRRARSRGASGARAPRGSPSVRATMRRSAPLRGSTRSASGPVSRSPRPQRSRTGSSGRLRARCALPRPSVMIAPRLPSPTISATANPTASGRQLVSRSSPTWIDIPTAASATRIRLRATVSRPAACSASIRPTVRRVASARNPRTNSGTARRMPRRPIGLAVDRPEPAGRPARRSRQLPRSACPDRGDQEQQRRHQRVADELDHGRDIERLGSERGAGGDDLARVVDGDPRPQAGRRLGETPARVRSSGRGRPPASRTA